MIEKINLVGDKTKKTNNYYCQTLIYANKKFIINYTRKADEKFNLIKIIKKRKLILKMKKFYIKKIHKNISYLGNIQLNV